MINGIQIMHIKIPIRILSLATWKTAKTVPKMAII